MSQTSQPTTPVQPTYKALTEDVSACQQTASTMDMAVYELQCWKMYDELCREVKKHKAEVQSQSLKVER